MKRILLRLSDDVTVRLDAWAGAEGLSRNAAIEKALDLVLPGGIAEPAAEHLKSGAVTPTRKDSKKLIGFDPSTGAPIYG